MHPLATSTVAACYRYHVYCVLTAWRRHSGGGFADVDNSTKDTRVERLSKIRDNSVLTLVTVRFECGLVCTLSTSGIAGFDFEMVWNADGYGTETV